MDSEPSYGDTEAEGTSNSEEGSPSDARLRRLSEDVERNSEQSSGGTSEAGQKAGDVSRVQRLPKHYNDHYVNVLNQMSVQRSEISETDLVETQVGSVTWSGLEKEKFFYVLSRKSKLDVPSIAASVGSKSELEVYDYLRLLEEEDRDRKLYATDMANVGLTEIPAAVEVSEECEAKLEKAADALGLYQGRFDRVVGEQAHPGLWLIDLSKAKSLDEAADNTEESDLPKCSPTSADDLFRLSSWVALIEQVFMKTRLSENEDIGAVNAAWGEVPAITQDAITDFYELALCQVRKLIQTSIFCAEARGRRVGERSHTAKAWIKQQDVAAATHLLAIKEDWNHFWVKLARRNRLQVRDHRRTKARSRGRGRGRVAILEYDKVESILSKISLARQRRRSVSSAAGSLSRLDNLTNVDDHASVLDASHSSDQRIKRRRLKQESRRQDASLRSNSQTSTSQISPRSGSDSQISTSSDDFSSSVDQNDDLETFDQFASQRAELHLYHDLGWAKPEDTHAKTKKAPMMEATRKRAKSRKTRVDFQDWRDSIGAYRESWEEYGDVIDETKFTENQRSHKRRRLDVVSSEPQHLPFRVLRS